MPYGEKTCRRDWGSTGSFKPFESVRECLDRLKYRGASGTDGHKVTLGQARLYFEVYLRESMGLGSKIAWELSLAFADPGNYAEFYYQRFEKYSGNASGKKGKDDEDFDINKAMILAAKRRGGIEYLLSLSDAEFNKLLNKTITNKQSVEIDEKRKDDGRTLEDLNKHLQLLDPEGSGEEPEVSEKSA